MPPVFGKEETKKPISTNMGDWLFYGNNWGEVSRIEYETSKKFVDRVVGKSGSYPRSQFFAILRTSR